MTANIIKILRVFGPGLGLFARAGFLFSRYGLLSRASEKRIPQKTSGARPPRRMVRTYSRPRPQVKENEAKKPTKAKDLAGKSRRHALR
jgi:hypothetical protein